MPERDLKKLLQNANPQLQPGEYVFVTVDQLKGFSPEEIVMSFREAEGHTLILEKTTADTLGLAYDITSCWITMNVHSALDAVGFTAAFATALAEHSLPCNVVAGYYHDHLFLPVQEKDRALRILQNLGPAT